MLGRGQGMRGSAKRQRSGMLPRLSSRASFIWRTQRSVGRDYGGRTQSTSRTLALFVREFVRELVRELLPIRPLRHPPNSGGGWERWSGTRRA
jgi:hypothetical protein